MKPLLNRGFTRLQTRNFGLTLVVLLPGVDPRGGTIRHFDPAQCCAGTDPQLQRANVEAMATAINLSQ
jgi:hypothetical protein